MPIRRPTRDHRRGYQSPFRRRLSGASSLWDRIVVRPTSVNRRPLTGQAAACLGGPLRAVLCRRHTFTTVACRCPSIPSDRARNLVTGLPPVKREQARSAKKQLDVARHGIPGTGTNRRGRIHSECYPTKMRDGLCPPDWRLVRGRGRCPGARRSHADFGWPRRVLLDTDSVEWRKLLSAQSCASPGALRYQRISSIHQLLGSAVSRKRIAI